MNTRTLLTALAVTLCLGSLWAVAKQRQQINELKAEQQRLAAAAPQADEPAPVTPALNAKFSGEAVSPELLRLRGEVTRLSSRKRELAGVAATSENLQAELDRRATHQTTGGPLPSGYLRKAQARLVGFDSPENTVQSFLWALQNHDLAKFMQALAPEMAQRLQARLQQSGESAEAFFKATEFLPGLAIRSRQSLPDGSVELLTEVAPGAPPQALKFQLIGGEWKLISDF